MASTTTDRRCSCRSTVDDFPMKRRQRPFQQKWILEGKWSADALKKTFENDAEQSLAPITSLTIRLREFRKEGMNALSKCAFFLPALNTLDASNKDLSDTDFLALTKCTIFPQLTNLNLSNNSLTSKSAHLLASSPSKSPLKLLTLNLSNNQLGVSSAQSLAKATTLSALRNLDLSANGFTEESVAELSPFFATMPDLNHLSLASNQIGSAGALALSHVASLSTLHTLNLAGTLTGPEGCKYICCSPHLSPNLQSLNLDSNDLGDAGIASLADYFMQSLHHRPCLSSLSLRLNQITSEGMKSLIPALQPEFLPFLHSISLGQNDISAEGVELLVSASKIQWKHLQLDRCSSGLEGLRAIASSPNLSHLESLDLSMNFFGVPGLQTFLAASYPRLRFLSIKNTLHVSANHFGSAKNKAVLDSSASSYAHLTPVAKSALPQFAQLLTSSSSQLLNGLQVLEVTGAEVGGEIGVRAITAAIASIGSTCKIIAQ